MPPPEDAGQMPTDWIHRPDGPDLLAAAIRRALTRGQEEDLEPLVAYAHDLIDVRAEDAARTLAMMLMVRTIRLDTEKFSWPEEATTDRDLLRLTDAYVPHAFTTSPYRIRLLGLVADLIRINGDYRSASALYGRISAHAESLGMALEAAAYLQSLGAVHADLGETDLALTTSSQASSRYLAIGERLRYVVTELNMAAVEIQAGRETHSLERLDRLSELVGQLNNGHYTASWRRLRILAAGEDTKETLDELKLLYRRRLRAHDNHLAQQLASDIAATTEAVHGFDRALRWWRRALDLAVAGEDKLNIARASRSVAVHLLRSGRYDEAVDLLEHAIEREGAVGPEEANRTLAELGAARMGQALARTEGRLSEEERDSVRADVERGRGELERALEYALTTDDDEFTIRVSANLALGFRVTSEFTHGAMLLERHARSLIAQGRSRLAAELLRFAAELHAHSAETMESAASLFQEVFEIGVALGDSDLTQLLEDAHTLGNSNVDLDLVLAAFDRAISLATAKNDLALAGDVLNDSAIQAANAGQTDVAVERLRRTEAMAEASRNRVLGALAKSNLGEVFMRERDFERAREYFAQASELASKIGDHEGSVEAEISALNCIIASEDAAMPDDLEQQIQQMRSDAESIGSPDIVARSMSVNASFQFRRGEHATAYQIWSRAANLAEITKRAEYREYALDALAEAGDFRRFSETLDRYFLQSQREGSQLDLSSHLWRTGMPWLRSRHARRAAKAFAYSSLLAIDGFSRRETVGSPSSEPDWRTYLHIAEALFPIRRILEGLEVEPDLVGDLNRWFDSYVVAVAGDEDGPELSRMVRTFGDGALDVGV